MSIHETAHEHAGNTVAVDLGPDGVHEYDVEDYWDRVTGTPWRESYGNPAAITYALRMAMGNAETPIDDEVVYGKIQGMGVLVHVSELRAA